MNESRQGAPPKMEPGSGNYWLFSLVALLVVVLGLLARGHVMWGLVLALVCAPGVVFRWRSAPVMLLLGVMLALTIQPTRPWFWAVAESDPLADLLLSAGVLGFIIANYRFQGLVHRIVPLAPGQRGAGAAEATTSSERPSGSPRECRSDRLVSTGEIAMALLSLPIWAGVAQLAWVLLPRTWTGLGIDARSWRAIVAIWLFGIGVFVAASVLGYLGRRHASLKEAAMPLQELLWQETRREQRIINRWLAWSRRRWRRRNP